MAFRLTKIRLSRNTFLSFLLFMMALVLVCAYSINELRNAIMDARKHEITTVLSMAKYHSVQIINQEKEGKISRQEAEKRVVAFLSSLNDGKSRYVWANDDNAFARVHVRQTVLGTFQPSYARDMSQLMQSDPFFVTGTSLKPVDYLKVIKMNGVTRLPEWNWTLGFGIYLDKSDETFRGHAITIIWGHFLIGLLVLLGVVLLHRERNNDLPG